MTVSSCQRLSHEGRPRFHAKLGAKPATAQLDFLGHWDSDRCRGIGRSIRAHRAAGGGCEVWRVDAVGAYDLLGSLVLHTEMAVGPDCFDVRNRGYGCRDLQALPVTWDGCVSADAFGDVDAGAGLLGVGHCCVLARNRGWSRFGCCDSQTQKPDLTLAFAGRSRVCCLRGKAQ